MLTWSTSATSSKPTLRGKIPNSKAAEEFLDSWDNAVFDGKSTGDPELDREASLWRDKFPHLRITGSRFESQKVTHPIPVDSLSFQKSIIQHSKSANAIREKLPKIDNFKKK
ncbi:DUF3719 domain-containing protein [Caenorhabditis elegans]|uniref:DUF3719 domain-containing protein n=1 Tax=Caenorhabditis elegans TaxID=6239 RepID=O61830_CAEEL|nr:DUF3719 domain-containing protein [Caenorhabditis elegans]CCD65344.1 DUF3719 domain-containing protein [Caenorhabditis elegans]|eukprot:NP_500165.1 X-BoX promoter element regulated [Caenorhabditis elegans]